jgi:hypothetical protein
MNLLRTIRWIVVALAASVGACKGTSEPNATRGTFEYTITTTGAQRYTGGRAQFFARPCEGGETLHCLEFFVGDSVNFFHFPPGEQGLPRTGTFQVGNGVGSDQPNRMSGDVYHVLPWTVLVDEEFSTITVESVAADRITARFEILLNDQATSERVGTVVGRFDARRIDRQPVR